MKPHPIRRSGAALLLSLVMALTAACGDKKVGGGKSKKSQYKVVTYGTCKLMPKATCMKGKKLILHSLENVDLSGANLEGTDFRDTRKFRNVLFVGANLKKARFKRNDLLDVDFSKADLTGAKIEESTLKRVSFAGATFGPSMVWFQTKVHDCDLRGVKWMATATRSEFNKCDARGADFTRAKSEYAFDIASFNHTNFSGTDFSGANLSGLHLFSCDLTSAKLDKAILRSTWLHGSKLTLAQLEKAIVKDVTCPDGFVARKKCKSTDSCWDTQAGWCKGPHACINCKGHMKPKKK